MPEYSNVFLIPQYSEIRTRKEVDTSVQLGNLKVTVPVISANMDTVTDQVMAVNIYKSGAIGALHRFSSIKENVEQYSYVKREKCECFVSIGVNEESKRRARALYNEGARYFVIDIAHGDHILMKEMISWLRNEFSDLYIMAGNVATAASTKNLISWGANAIKVGIGPGAACLTKNVTGVTVPQFNAVIECARAIKALNAQNIILVADGGIKEIGDVAKALAAGADLVMSGKMFAMCYEAPNPGLYRGSASIDVMKTHRKEDLLPTPEGIAMNLEPEYSVQELVAAIKGGLQSAFSYSNARNLFEFKTNALIGYK